jgi:hypothetical protein
LPAPGTGDGSAPPPKASGASGEEMLGSSVNETADDANSIELESRLRRFSSARNAFGSPR